MKHTPFNDINQPALANQNMKSSYPRSNELQKMKLALHQASDENQKLQDRVLILESCMAQLNYQNEKRQLLIEELQEQVEELRGGKWNAKWRGSIIEVGKHGTRSKSV